MKARKVATALCSVGVVMMMTGVTVSAEKTQLNVATELTSSSLDPAFDHNACWFPMRWGVLETLTKFADDGAIVPWLAESYEVAEDQLTWTIKIKDNICFSNGVPMTASKVVESLERLYEIQDPANGGSGYPQSYFTYSEITADDENRTVTIVTEKPTVDLPGCLAYPWTGIIDVEASEKRDITKDGPIATGAYAFVSNDPEHDIQLAKNEYYWDGAVPFETVNVMKLSEGSTRAMALQDGSADMAINITSMDRSFLESDDRYLIDVTAGSRMGNCYINFDGVLGNDDLRHAVMQAIDGETICNVSVGGSYSYTNNEPLPGTYSGGLNNTWSYDPDAAKVLLDEAGIVDTDGDGYRELDGETIDLNYVSSTSRQQDVIAQAQAAQLEAIGIKCSVSFPENSSELRTSQGFDLLYNNEVTTPTGDPANFLRHWYGKVEDTSYNYGNYHNDEFDALYDQLAGEFDNEKRMEIFTQLQQIMMDDVASIVYGSYNFNLCAAPSVDGVHSNVSDFYWVTKDIVPAE